MSVWQPKDKPWDFARCRPLFAKYGELKAGHIEHNGERFCDPMTDEPAPKKRVTSAQLRKSLRFLIEAAETEPSMAMYRAHIDQAKQLLTAS